jgi:DNA-binding CsgD family transcriptional regulator
MGHHTSRIDLTAMNSEISQSNSSHMPLTNKVIYVLGPRRFQNELIASFLERETGARCVPAQNIRQILFTDNKKVGTRRQVLWDCLGENLETLVLEIESYGKRLLARDLVTFFNVKAGTGIEEKAVMLGVRGFFYEHDSMEIFLKGIRAVFDGELWFPRKIMTKCILKNKIREPSPEENRVALTKRENEVLTMVAVGASNEDIADRLCISPHTVKTHVYNIFKKIDVPNRLQAAFWAAKNL